MTLSTFRGLGLGLFMGAAILLQLGGAPAQAQELAVTIDNFTFTPQTLTVKAGTTVTWNNHDDIPHGIASDNNAFQRSKALDTDDKFAFTFTTPGTYNYSCYFHRQMKGTIVVREAGNID